MTESTDHFIDPQEIDLSKLKLSGRILDIGGGGDFYIVPTRIKLSDSHTISPGYGVSWKGREMSGEDLIEAGKQAGFAIRQVDTFGQSFHIRMVK